MFTYLLCIDRLPDQLKKYEWNPVLQRTPASLLHLSG